jgi:hypothetical protein
MVNYPLDVYAALTFPMSRDSPTSSIGWMTGGRFTARAVIFSLHHHVQIDSGVHASSSGGYWGKSGRGVKLTAHFHLVQSLRTRATSPVP